MNSIPPRSEAEANFPAGEIAAKGVLYEFFLALRDDLYIEVAAVLSSDWSSEVRPGCDGQTTTVGIATRSIGR